MFPVLSISSQTFASKYHTKTSTGWADSGCNKVYSITWIMIIKVALRETTV